MARHLKVLILTLFSALLCSCTANVEAPKMNLPSPTASPLGTPVAITGSDPIGSTSATSRGARTSPSGLTSTGPAPTIRSFSPTSAPVGSPATRVTILGDHLSGLTSISWNGYGLTNFTSAGMGQISATIPAVDLETPASSPFGVSTSGQNAFSTASFTCKPVPHVSSIALSSGAIVGGQTVVGTVNITSAAPVRGATVALFVSDSGGSVPKSAFIPGGSTSAKFILTSNKVETADTYDVSATYGGWTQTAELTVTPYAVKFAISNLTAYSGNGCAGLSWDPLSDGTFAGYDVYAIVGNTATKLNSVPITEPYFAERDLTNGTVYSYEVRMVSLFGAEVARSSVVTVTPTPSAPTVSWVSPPTTATGLLALTVAFSTGRPIGYNVFLVDGNLDGGIGIVADQMTRTAHYEADVDTSQFSNGPHVFQVASFSDDNVAVTKPLTIQVSNDIPQVGSDGFFDATADETIPFTAHLPADVTSWTLEIVNDSTNAVVRSWPGYGSSVSAAWDGRDGHGKLAPPDSYDFLLTDKELIESATSTETHTCKEPFTLVTGSQSIGH